MTNSRKRACLLGLAMMTLSLGCSPAYHSYSGCYVDCKYCAPPALPYTHYEGCVCHSCAASKYLSLEPLSAEEDAETDNNQARE